jgi:cell division septum initiation protein DivIVA
MKKEALVKVTDYTKGELLEETERLDREIQQANRIARINAERIAKERREQHEAERKRITREINAFRYHLGKPILQGIVKVNMKSGKARSVKQGEINPMRIDHSSPSYADGDIVLPEKEVLPRPSLLT